MSDLIFHASLYVLGLSAVFGLCAFVADWIKAKGWSERIDL